MPTPSVPCAACIDPNMACDLHPKDSLPPLNPFLHPPRYFHPHYPNPPGFSAPFQHQPHASYPYAQQYRTHKGANAFNQALFSGDSSRAYATGSLATHSGAYTHPELQGFARMAPPPSPLAQRSNQSAGSKRKNAPTVEGTTEPRRRRKARKGAQDSVPLATVAGIGPSIQHGAANANPTEQRNLPSTSVPPTYVARDPTTSKANRDLKDLATGASDCWIHMQGVNESDLPGDPRVIKAAKEEYARRVKELTPEDLHRPDAKYSRVLCLVCLCSLGQWKTWGNSDGGIIKGIRTHLKKYHGTVYSTGCREIGSSHVDNEAQPNSSPDDVTGKEITSEGLAWYIAELIADQDLAFNLVQAKTFRRLLCYVGQGNIQASDIPERRTVSKVSSDLSQNEKDRLKEDMKQAQGRISLTSDLWTDVMERPFMAITSHYVNAVDEDVATLIAFRIVEGAHAGVILARHIFRVLKEYDIVHKIGSITLDNASNNNTMMEELSRLIRAEGYDFDEEGNRIRCFPHIINLAVTAFLDALDVTGDKYLASRYNSDRPPSEKTENYVYALKKRPDKKCRATVVALRKGQRRVGLRQTIVEGNEKAHFKERKLLKAPNLEGVLVDTIVERLIKIRLVELLLDVPTRWSSTRDMLDRFAELYPAIWEYLNKNKEAFSDMIMSDLEFKVLQDILTCLNVPHQAQELLSAEKTPTLSLHSRFTINLSAPGIQEYIAKSRSSPIHIVAMVLNPCIKYTWIDSHWTEEEKRLAREIVKGFMLKYLEARERQSTVTGSEDLSTQASQAQGRGINALFMEPERCLYDDEFGVTPPQSPAAPARIQPTPKRPLLDTFTLSPYASSPSRAASIHQKLTVNTEHERYVKEKVLPLSELGKTDLVKHWTRKRGAEVFTPAGCCDGCTPAQASSVSSEQVFSSSKLTCTRARNRMKANTVESLQILKYAIRNRYKHKRASVAANDKGGNDDTSPQGSQSDQSEDTSDSSSLDFMTRLGDADWGHDAILDEDLDINL
ncbi:hAT family C-terminal dimerization region [Rhizoctonia solani]|uniref:HAT family C-terminal dimerization region n=1 Tax=Rhizoctonia solani TaxID=456999 RepID=A0A8H7I7N8_9AGAM|nr:hAT family C-terminal dimerization region [Rhizoctonia solani]